MGFINCFSMVLKQFLFFKENAVENPNRVVFLSGRTTNLRPYNKADIPMLTRWINSPDVRPFIVSVFPKTENLEEEWYEKLGKDDKNIVLCVETKDGKPIGGMGIHSIDWLNRTATTGAILGEKEYWGQGFGTDAKLVLLDYAFNVLNLRKIHSNVIGYNERSLRYSLRCGYKEEGRLRQEKYRNGEYHDLIQLSVFREDWLPVYERYMQTGSVR